MIFLFSQKNKKYKEGLEKALAFDLITKKEYLELKLKRAEIELGEYTKVKVKVKTKK